MDVRLTARRDAGAAKAF
nr:hypothetical protein [Jannaschia donghaensis]